MQGHIEIHVAILRDLRFSYYFMSRQPPNFSVLASFVQFLLKLFLGDPFVWQLTGNAHPYLCRATSLDNLSDRYAPIRSSFSGADRA